MLELGLVVTRPYLERYQSCKTAEEVNAAQENIIQELEQDYESSRRDKGQRPTAIFAINCRTHSDELVDARQGSSEDLLIMNPNHRSAVDHEKGEPPASDTEGDTSGDDISGEST